MKELIRIQRSLVEQLAKIATEGPEDTTVAEDLIEQLSESFEHLEPLVEHLDNYDEFDTESWVEELRQLVAELDD